MCANGAEIDGWEQEGDKANVLMEMESMGMEPYGD